MRWPRSSATLPRTAADDGGHERGRGDGEAGPEQRVVPDVAQVEHVREQVGVEARTGHDRQHVAERERPHAHQRRGRAAVRGGAASSGRSRPAPGPPPGRSRRSGRRSSPSRGPVIRARDRSPSAAASASAPTRSGILRTPGERLSTSARRATSTAAMPSGRLMRKARRELDSSTSAPPTGGPRPDAIAAAAPHSPTPCARRERLEALDHERQRGRDEQSGTEPLQHAEGDELPHRPRERRRAPRRP